MKGSKQAIERHNNRVKALSTYKISDSKRDFLSKVKDQAEEKNVIDADLINSRGSI